MGFYVDEADRSATSYPAAETIVVGSACTVVNETVELMDADGNATFDGVADSPRAADYIAEEYDEGSEFEYKNISSKVSTDSGANVSDRVPLRGDEDAAIIRLKTAKDNDTDPSPSISNGDTVGVANVGTSEFEGRIVESGYTDDGATTYDEDSDNFVAIGTAYKDSSSEFDDVVRLKVGGHE